MQNYLKEPLNLFKSTNASPLCPPLLNKLTVQSASLYFKKNPIDFLDNFPLLRIANLGYRKRAIYF